MLITFQFIKQYNVQQHHAYKDNVFFITSRLNQFQMSLSLRQYGLLNNLFL